MASWGWCCLFGWCTGWPIWLAHWLVLAWCFALAGPASPMRRSHQQRLKRSAAPPARVSSDRVKMATVPKNPYFAAEDYRQFFTRSFCISKTRVKICSIFDRRAQKMATDPKNAPFCRRDLSPIFFLDVYGPAGRATFKTCQNGYAGTYGQKT